MSHLVVYQKVTHFKSSILQFKKLKDIIWKIRRQSREIKKTFIILISNKDLIPKIYQEHLQFNTNKTQNRKIFKQTLYKKRCANGQ